MTSVDYVVIALSPFLIMLLVGSLSFFLLELGYRGELTTRLRWILFWFVIGTVGIARISMEEGAERASIYGLGLAGAVALAAWRLVDSPFLCWGLMAVVWWCAHKLTWDCTLIDEEQDASGEGLLQVAGLEEGIGNGTPAAGSSDDEKPRRRNWWQRFLESPEERRKRPHAPGVWVIYFSLAALPLFGLGQALIPAGDIERRRTAFWLLVWYVASGMGLLLTTSFLGLRRYLRQRKLEMPVSMTGVWLGVGGTLIVLLILVMMLIPRPSPEYPVEELIANAIRSPVQQASRHAVMRDGGVQQGPADAKPANPPHDDSQTNRSQQPEQKDPPGGQQQAGGQQQGGQQQGGQQQSGQQQGGQQQGGQQQGGQQQGGQQQGGQQQGGPQQGGQQQGGQQRSGQQQGGQQQGGQQQSGQQQGGQQQGGQQQGGQQQGGQQQGGQQQGGQQQSGQQQGGQQSGQQQSGQQAGGQQQGAQQQGNQQQTGQQQGSQQQSGPQNQPKEQPRNQSPAGQPPTQPSAERQQERPSDTNQQQGQQPQAGTSKPETPPPQPSRLPKLPSLSLAGWIRWLMWGALAVAAIIGFLRYREQVIAFLRQLWAELLALWGELFGGRKTKSADVADPERLEPPRPFAAFRNPFASGKDDRLPPEQLVRYTFEALDAWAFEHQAARRLDETPLEFADAVGDRHPALAQDTRQLARLYSQMVYARTNPTHDCLPLLRRLWDEMTRRARQPVGTS
ncbi:MAG TPA: DUF4129 domain-containing protein [Pirellulales bacterium]|nr:DUF4129 domain-containing protein [Pirellulales bacterium]